MKSVVSGLKSFIYKNRDILFLIFVCFIVLIPILFIGNIPKNHDVHFHMSRILGIKDMMALGDFKALIHGTFFGGYGYANGLFYANFFLYLPALLCYFGVSVFTSYKVLIIVCTFLTAFSMYYCAKKISLSKLAATIAAILYTAAPYRIIDVYQRGAVGEVLAFIFVPFVILGLYQLLYKDYKQWWYLVIGFGGLLLSHLITFTIVLLTVFIFILINVKRLIDKPQRILFLFISGFICVLLTAFFLFPMIEQLLVSDLVLNNVTKNWNISANAMPLINAFLGIRMVAFPCGIGLIFIIISLIFIKTPKRYGSMYKFCRALLITGTVLLLVTTTLFPWEMVAPFLASLQFPWRFLLPAVAFLSISSGIIIHYVCKTLKWNKYIIVISIMVISLISPIIIMHSEYMNNKTVIDMSKYVIGYGEYLPYKTNYKELFVRGNVITVSKVMDYTFTKKGTTIVVDYNSNVTSNYMEVPLLYYYGYKAINLDTNKELKIAPGTNNIIRVYLDDTIAGKVKIYYAGTLIQHISSLVSIVSLILLIGYYFYKKYKKRYI